MDHESTPAQYTVDHRQAVTRFLVTRGCKTDILMAAALGDLELVKTHLDADPDCIRMRVTDESFPMVSPKSGGTIYQSTMGFHVWRIRSHATSAMKILYNSCLIIARSP